MVGVNKEALRGIMLQPKTKAEAKQDSKEFYIALFKCIKKQKLILDELGIYLPILIFNADTGITLYKFNDQIQDIGNYETQFGRDDLSKEVLQNLIEMSNVSRPSAASSDNKIEDHPVPARPNSSEKAGDLDQIAQSLNLTEASALSHQTPVQTTVPRITAEPALHQVNAGEIRRLNEQSDSRGLQASAGIAVQPTAKTIVTDISANVVNEEIQLDLDAADNTLTLHKDGQAEKFIQSVSKKRIVGETLAVSHGLSAVALGGATLGVALTFKLTAVAALICIGKVIAGAAATMGSVAGLTGAAAFSVGTAGMGLLAIGAVCLIAYGIYRFHNRAQASEKPRGCFNFAGNNVNQVSVQRTPSI